jgi:surfeit locus 1 family protein
MKKKPPFWATIFMFPGLIVLCSLGTWQVKRLAWKTELLTQIDAIYAAEPERLGREQLFQESPEPVFIARGTVRGRYVYSKEIMIQPRTHNGKTGYHVITPFALEDGGGLLVNRGWVPRDWKNTKSDKQKKKTITGVLRRPERANLFVPGNDPDNNQWYRLDVEEIIRHHDLKYMSPYVFYAETLEENSEFPIPHDKNWRPRNSHLQYAFFWFSMAGLLVLIYILRFLL